MEAHQKLEAHRRPWVVPQMEAHRKPRVVPQMEAHRGPRVVAQMEAHQNGSLQLPEVVLVLLEVVQEEPGDYPMDDAPQRQQQRDTCREPEERPRC